MRVTLSGARLQRAQQQLVSAASIKATKETQAVAEDVSAVEINLGAVTELTAGLDVTDINSKIAQLNDRVEALEV